MTPPDAEENAIAPELPQGLRRLRGVESAEAQSAALTPQRAPTNLPLELSSFVGREKELAEVERQLEGNRLLTLTGSGGCGKTRLALAAATDLVEGFENGVWLVELAPLVDPSLVPQAVASTLGLRDQPGRSPAEILSRYLVSKKVLLVLDNCEHLVEACAALAEALLRFCPGLRVLATSREALGITGEVAWPVPPLSLPDLRRMPDVESLPRYESARLFVDRAAAVRTDFALTEQNARAVARICYRLDGIPLAIELAAARTKVLSVEEISERLDNSFELLASGGRTAIPRQRTLHATMDWSHDLLLDEERTLFRRLSVFAGGFNLEAAEAVCRANGLERDGVPELLWHLVDKSLVVTRKLDGEARYSLLETVRQYGREKLDDSGEGAELGRRHAGFYVELAEEAERGLGGPEQRRWLTLLEAEHDNLRAALDWSLGEGGDARLGVRLAAALGTFWSTRGYLSEGRRWLEGAVSRSDPGATRARAKALNGAGWVAMLQDEYGAARRLFEEGLSLNRELSDEEGIASSLVNLGSAAMMGQRDDVPVVVLLEEAKELRPELEDQRTVARMVLLESMVLLGQDARERMVALNEESLALFRELKYDYGVVMCLTNLGLVSLAQDDYERATTLLREDLRLARELDHKLYVQYCLTGLAGVDASLGLPVRAARLWGAAEAMSEAYGGHIMLADRSIIDYEGRLAAARSQLDEAAWNAAWTEGRAMTSEQAKEYALEQEPAPEPAAPEAYPSGLSVREVDVLRLVATGLTNAEVAERLFLSSRTVDWHMGSIYRKLEIHSRAEATRFAGEHGLL